MVSNVPQVYKLSCKSCRFRKVKCNRVLPCAPCQRSKVDCVFPKPARQPGSKSRNAEITKRLAQLEQLVGKLGNGEVSSTATNNQELGIQTPESPKGTIADQEVTKTNELEVRTKALEIREHEPIVKSDGTRYISGDFWANISGEVCQSKPGMFSYRQADEDM